MAANSWLGQEVEYGGRATEALCFDCRSAGATDNCGISDSGVY
ncbi:MAG: hypothetical protein ACREQR_14035 [Candidatus Binataceae bacterium]